MNYLLPTDEEARLQELRRFAVLDTPPEKAFDDITQLAAQIFGVPISAVALVDEDRTWFKSCYGLETREVGRDGGICAYALLSDEVMVVPDARADPRFARSALVTGPPFVRFYAGAPLRTANGLNLGMLCILDSVPREFPQNGRATLASLAALVVDELQLRYEIGERTRKAENLRLLQAAIQQNGQAVAITTAHLDSSGLEFVFVNPAFSILTGYLSEEVMGKDARTLQEMAGNLEGMVAVHAELAAGREASFEMDYHRRDGSAFLLGTRIAPIQDAEGKVTHFICFLHDATEERRAASALQAAMEEANRANHAKSEFLSRMSHELRTPLHAILGFAQLLEMDAENRVKQESAAQITFAGQHLLSLINEVLDLAQAQAGELEYSPEPVNVCAAVEEMLSLVKPLAAEAGVRLEPLKSTICEVQTSERRFKQVILNLLSNAVKFNHRGGSVSVSCEANDERARITIADTGRGIAAHNLAKLFVPFERLDLQATDAGGSGLGLSLSKQLIEALGGRIGVESTQWEGSTFWVELPIGEILPGNRLPLSAVEDAREEAPRSQAPRTILYIEDNLSNLRLVERILARRPEITLISATQGRAALELARQHQPVLILLDLHLPDLSGDEVLRQLRADPGVRVIPVVMLSADATAAQVTRLRDLGAADYLTKPISVRKFLALVDATAPRRAADPSPAILAPLA